MVLVFPRLFFIFLLILFLIKYGNSGLYYISSCFPMSLFPSSPSKSHVKSGLDLFSCTFNYLKYRNLEYWSPGCYAESTNPLCIPPWRFKRIMMLDYMIKAHMYTHKGTQRDNSRRGTPNNILPWLLPGPSQEPSSHQKHIRTSPEEHRGTKTGDNTN